MKRIKDFLAAVLVFALTPLRRYFESVWQFNAVTLQDFQQGRVVIPGSAEAIRWSFYDHILYPGAGVNQLDFFQLPQGQGITSAVGAAVGGAKSLFDTNMLLQGQMPRYFDFLLQLVEVYLYPGSSLAANTFVPAPLAGVHADPIVAADLASVNDHNTFRNSGLLVLTATDKDYIREAPLLRFPPASHLGLSSAFTSVAGNIGFAKLADAFGRAYYVQPNITLTSNQNFVVSLRWPALVAMPSTFNARVGVVLSGVLKRAAQ